MLDRGLHRCLPLLLTLGCAAPADGPRGTGSDGHVLDDGDGSDGAAWSWEVDRSRPFWSGGGGDGGAGDGGAGDGGAGDGGAGDGGWTPGDGGGVEPRGIPFGFWGLNGYQSPEGFDDLEGRFGLTHFHTATSDPNWAVEYLLPMVQEAGMTVSLRISGAHEHEDREGNFDIDSWKDSIAEWDGAGLTPYIDDGTLIAHMLLDDILNYSGRDPTAEELDEMARFSKEHFPGLMTFVRVRASSIPVPESGRYEHVDAVEAHYRAHDGDIDAYVAREQEHAESMGLLLITGLNMADGGDGSSGQPGWLGEDEGKWAMSADELLTYGTALIEIPDCVIFQAWEYDGEEVWPDGTIGSDYFDQPDNQAALAALGVLAAAHPAVELD